MGVMLVDSSSGMVTREITTIGLVLSTVAKTRVTVVASVTVTIAGPLLVSLVVPWTTVLETFLPRTIPVKTVLKTAMATADVSPVVLDLTMKVATAPILPLLETNGMLVMVVTRTFTIGRVRTVGTPPATTSVMLLTNMVKTKTIRMAVTPRPSFRL